VTDDDAVGMFTLSAAAWSACDEHGGNPGSEVRVRAKSSSRLASGFKANASANNRSNVATRCCFSFDGQVSF
jgi:hypothetical protein